MNIKSRLESLERFGSVDVTKLSDMELEAILRSPGPNFSQVADDDLAELSRMLKSDPASARVLQDRLYAEGLLTYNG